MVDRPERRDIVGGDTRERRKERIEYNTLITAEGWFECDDGRGAREGVGDVQGKGSPSVGAVRDPVGRS